MDTHAHKHTHICLHWRHVWVSGCTAGIDITAYWGVHVSSHATHSLFVCVTVPNESHSRNHAIWSWQCRRWWLHAHRLPALKSPSLSLRIHIQGLAKWLFSLSFPVTHTHTHIQSLVYHKSRQSSAIEIINVLNNSHCLLVSRQCLDRLIVNKLCENEDTMKFSKALICLSKPIGF